MCFLREGEFGLMKYDIPGIWDFYGFSWFIEFVGDEFRDKPAHTSNIYSRSDITFALNQNLLYFFYNL
jgi:hypothetical protein